MPIYDDAIAAYFGYPSRPGTTPGAIDFSPHGRHGFQVGTVGPTEWVDSVTLGRPALVFPGTGTGFDDLGKIVVGPPLVGAGTFSVVYWSLIGVSRDADCVATRLSATGLGFNVGWDSNRRTVGGFGDGTNNRLIRGQQIHPLDTWLHVVHEFDRTAQQYRCWVNNTAQTFFDSTDLTGIGSLTQTAGRMTLGCVAGATATPFHGRIFAGRLADVMIFPRVLTSQERADLADPQFLPYTPPAGGASGPSMQSPYLIGEEIAL